MIYVRLIRITSDREGGKAVIDGAVTAGKILLSLPNNIKKSLSF